MNVDFSTIFFQNEIQRAIQQCKEQSFSMLERSLNAVEKASADGGVYPEVMFEVGRHWCYLFEKHTSSSSSASAGGGGNNAPASPAAAATAGGGGARHSSMAAAAAAQPHHPPQLRPDQFNPIQGTCLLRFPASFLSFLAPKKAYGKQATRQVSPHYDLRGLSSF